MEQFDALIKKDGSGRLTVAEISFNAKEVFHKTKGTIYVNGTVNDIAYRSNKLEPVSVIAFGWPDEEKELPPRRETAMVHYDRW